jgi:hypothetical protein
MQPTFLARGMFRAHFACQESMLAYSVTSTLAICSKLKSELGLRSSETNLQKSPEMMPKLQFHGANAGYEPGFD